LDIGLQPLQPALDNKTVAGDETPPSKCNSAFGGLLVRKESWRLSWRGKLILALVLLGALLAVGLNVYPWLATTNRVQSDYLVVEGWIGVYALKQAVSEFNAAGYKHILTTGSMGKDEGSREHKRTFADWSAQDLQKLGIAGDLITPIPSWVEQKDRTYSSAMAVKNWFVENRIPVQSIDVVTLGPHARRTRLLYEKAFGNEVQVGIIAAEGQDYDSAHWWRTSEGVREVVGETIAYVYARLFFHPADKTFTEGN
jgi:hypothetical protein